jgi:ferredoxin-NADP reductase
MNLISAKIESIEQGTPKIKIFRLRHGNSDYHFRPGQWIDLHVPIDGKNIGGYTIISSARTREYIELAVRESLHHPVTKFLHEAKPETLVDITIGQGNFFLKDEIAASGSLTFIAGGIGLTPILSMIRSLDKSKTKLKLFYSVSHEEDILFREELTPFTIFTVTKGPDTKEVKARISVDHLKKYQADFQSHFFICGPRAMIDSLTAELKESGVPSDHIHFEKWW